MLIKHNDVNVNNIENVFNKKSILFKGFYQIYILNIKNVFAFTHLSYLSLNTMLKKKCLILSANVHSSYMR